MNSLIRRWTTVALLAPASVCAQPTRAQVDTESGPVVGIGRHGVVEYRGIPYAAPPVGALRWRPPQPAAPWPRARDATRFGAACPQLARYHLTEQSLNEDCLTVNVSTPMGPPPQGGWPVLAWIHGGAFVGGGSHLYRLDALAREGVVVVSMNYRLGVLGFLAQRSLGDDAGDLGLQDQRAALAWVGRNIAAFGGDPHRITLAGESAGAGSVCAHLVAPASHGLFAQAIIQSAGCLQPLPTVADGMRLGDQIAADSAVHCATATDPAGCLRQTPVKVLLQAAERAGAAQPLPFTPLVGSPSLPQQPAEVIRAAAQQRMPLLLGGTRDELRLYLGYWRQAGQTITRENYPAWLRKFYGPELAPQVQRRYPLTAATPPAVTLGTAMSDFLPTVGINNCLYLSTAALLAQTQPVYAFEFADRGALVRGVGIAAHPDPGLELGATHAAELNYLFPHFSNTAAIDAPSLPPASQRLAQTMRAYWIAFVKTGHPAVDGAPRWPQFAGGATVMRLQPGAVGPYDAEQAHGCRFWRQLYPERLAH